MQRPCACSDPATPAAMRTTAEIQILLLLPCQTRLPLLPCPAPSSQPHRRACFRCLISTACSCYACTHACDWARQAHSHQPSVAGLQPSSLQPPGVCFHSPTCPPCYLQPQSLLKQQQARPAATQLTLACQQCTHQPLTPPPLTPQLHVIHAHTLLSLFLSCCCLSECKAHTNTHTMPCLLSGRRLLYRP